MYCEDKDGNGYIFVYDFKYGIWHRESLHKAPGLIERGTVPKIIDITTDGNRVLLAAGNGHIIYDGESGEVGSVLQKPRSLICSRRAT